MWIERAEPPTVSTQRAPPRQNGGAAPGGRSARLERAARRALTATTPRTAPDARARRGAAKWAPGAGARWACAPEAPIRARRLYMTWNRTDLDPEPLHDTNAARVRGHVEPITEWTSSHARTRTRRALTLARRGTHTRKGQRLSKCGARPPESIHEMRIDRAEVLRLFLRGSIFFYAVIGCDNWRFDYLKIDLFSILCISFW